MTIISLIFVRCPLVIRDAVCARDTLAKTLYCILFEQIVAKMNESNADISKLNIGILDCAGFGTSHHIL